MSRVSFDAKIIDHESKVQKLSPPPYRREREGEERGREIERERERERERETASVINCWHLTQKPNTHTYTHCLVGS